MKNKMKIKDLYGLDDNIEHFVIHTAEEEFSSVHIVKTVIKRGKDSIIFDFYCDRFDGDRSSGKQEDLSKKLQDRVDKYHKNFIKNVVINVYQE